MITLAQYFAGQPHSHDQELAAMVLLARVENLLREANVVGRYPETVNPKTGNQISGEGNGGFRTPECPIGAPKSSHKEAKAVDIYDPDDSLDEWITDDILRKFDLYREDKGATKSWSHLTTRPPSSGRRTFLP